MSNVNNNCIVIFCGYYLPHLGGIERYTQNLAKQLKLNGYKTVVVSSNFNNSKDSEYIDDVLYLRLPIYKTFKNRYPIVKNNKLCKDLIKKLDSLNIKAIIVNTRFHLTSHVGANYGHKHNIPVYLIEHGSRYITTDNKFLDFFANKYEDFLTWKIKKKVKGFYGVSKSAADWLVNFNIKASGVWYNSIDTDQPLPEKIRHDSINFLFAGRILKQKGVENILQAFKKLETKYSNIRLYIAGDGPELEQLKRSYQSYNIVYLGKLDYESLLKQYALCDVFLYPPFWPEGLPTSILEAGLMKCAFIGTNQNGINEIIINKYNGLLINNAYEDLIYYMELLINHEDLIHLYSENLNKTTINNFAWIKTIKTIINDLC